MPDDTIAIGPDLVRALDVVLGHDPAEAIPVVVVAAFLDQLAKGHGLSESETLEDDRLQDISVPAFAADALAGLLGDIEDREELADRVYAALVATAPVPATRKALNKSKPLSEVNVRLVGQIYWNLKGTDARPKLPRRPREVRVDGKTVPIDLPAAKVGEDFATMLAADRSRAELPDKVTGNRFRQQGALLAVLMAKHIVESSPVAPGGLEGVEFIRSEGAKGSPRAIVGVASSAPTGLPKPSMELAGHIPFGKDSATAPSAISSRERAEYLIDNLEEDLRQSIERLLLGHMPTATVLGPDHGKALARQESSAVSDGRSLASFLLPQEAYDVLLRHIADLPTELAVLLERNFVDFEMFLPARNRVMKGRPLQPGDLDQASEFVDGFLSGLTPRASAAAKRLAERPDWQPRRRAGSDLPDSVLHNLPAPDFDETGLLGRESQIQDVVRLLKSPRERIITLIGEGGVGKTALAVEIAYRLVDDPESPFEYVLWTTLKYEALTARGIQSLSNAVRDLVSAAGDLGHFLDSKFEGDASDLAALFGASRALIVVDNMETTLGDDVVAFADSLPEATILFTSRRGVSSLERRVPVGALEPGSAAQLFRTFAEHRRSDLAGMSDTRLNETLRLLRYSPLAIRWCVLSVLDGRPLADVLHHQDDLLKYCVGNVVGGLSRDSKTILSMLRALDRPVSVQELAVVSDIDIDAFSEAMKLLVEASLVVRSYVADDIERERLALSSTARAYLPPAEESELLTRTLQRERLLQEDHERDQQKVAETGRYFDPNVVFQRTPHDGPVAYLLRQALREAKSDDVEAADAFVARARALDPTYFEVDRVDAFLASMRREAVKATTLYQSARNYADTDEQRYWVDYFYAAHLARTVRDIEGAIELAEKTHAHFNRYDTGLPLGNYYAWVGRFTEGYALIESAVEHAPTVKTKRIATTALVDCLRLWATDELKAGSVAAALRRARDGAWTGLQLHLADSTDEQLVHAITRALTIALEAARQSAPDEESVALLADVVQHLTSEEGPGGSTVLRSLEYQVIGLPDDLRERIAPGVAADLDRPRPRPRLRGTVRNFGETYGFIAHPDFPKNVFFQKGWLTGGTQMNDLAVGSIVEFTPSKNDKGQDQALHVVAMMGERSERRDGQAPIHGSPSGSH
ncbi:NB-ARC domain-containing protein [Nocardioides aequoreus]|uniref:NB-ARC domain-containing protein n=1 Tax=Nocardioides aequoreus TaxID=397278 RepID=UPI0004C30EA2|nr:NB-ARC domain-containing protein [Nocardioides aequoreus]